MAMMATNPCVAALERAEKLIALFYQGMTDIQQITRDSLVDDDEKVEQIAEQVEKTLKDIAAI